MRLIKLKCYPNSKIVSYLFDKDGNKVECTNKDLSKVVYEYNELSQLTSETAGLEKSNFSYTADGLVLNAWNSNAFVENSFNDFGSLIQIGTIK